MSETRLEIRFKAVKSQKVKLQNLTKSQRVRRLDELGGFTSQHHLDKIWSGLHFYCSQSWHTSFHLASLRSKWWDWGTTKWKESRSQVASNLSEREGETKGKKSETIPVWQDKGWELYVARSGQRDCLYIDMYIVVWTSLRSDMLLWSKQLRWL